MKKIMLSALFMAFATTATFAVMPETTSIEITVQEEKTPLKIEELPDAVKTTLSGEQYIGWAPTQAFTVTPEDGPKYFQVTIKKDDETKIVNLQEDGREIQLPEEAQ